MHEAGKGDKRRPGDDKAFDSNYDSIFGKSAPTRGSWIWDEAQGKMVDRNEYVRPTPEVHMIIGDIQPYQSMVDGSMIGGRRQHREHLKRNGLIEIGNETKHLKSYGDYSNRPGLKDEIIKNVHLAKEGKLRKFED